MNDISFDDYKRLLEYINENHGMMSRNPNGKRIKYVACCADMRTGVFAVTFRGGVDGDVTFSTENNPKKGWLADEIYAYLEPVIIMRDDIERKFKGYLNDNHTRQMVRDSIAMAIRRFQNESCDSTKFEVVCDNINNPPSVVDRCDLVFSVTLFEPVSSNIKKMLERNKIDYNVKQSP